LSQNADATIMLPTSHESIFSHSEWKDIIQRRGLNMNQLESLMENSDFLNRKEEILNWFKTNEIHEDFVIMDDDQSLSELPNPHHRHKPMTEWKLLRCFSVPGVCDR
jgi:hypothetical protein